MGRGGCGTGGIGVAGAGATAASAAERGTACISADAIPGAPNKMKHPRAALALSRVDIRPSNIAKPKAAIASVAIMVASEPVIAPAIQAAAFGRPAPGASSRVDWASMSA